MADAGREIAEGHLEFSADLRLQIMHGAGEAVGREPFRERIRLDNAR
jgi:hypothetical protein